MTIDHEPQVGSNLTEIDIPGVPVEMEQALDQIGVQYLADLRMLSETFSQFYSALLAARDDRIAELGRQLEVVAHERDEQDALSAAQDQRIAELTQRLEITELRRRELESQIQMFRQIGARCLADLQTLSEHLSQPLEVSENESYTVWGTSQEAMEDCDSEGNQPYETTC